ncbi:MAG: hypothetical protein E7665_06880 [Ruminococcaceae bacterium]|nr:hypothetical protein [Oscillospiraceae bacterium]
MKRTLSRISVLILTTMLILAFSSCAPANESIPEAYSGKTAMSVPRLEYKAEESDRARSENTSTDTVLEIGSELKSEPESKESAPSQKAEQRSSVPAAEASELMTREEALSAALEHANLDKADIRDVEVELDIEKGVKVWEVEFDSQMTDHSYRIAAYNGEILHFHTKKESAPAPKIKSEPESKESAPSQKAEQRPSVPAAEASELMTREEALSAALEHAKLDKADIRDVEIELDIEKGVKVWEVEFESGRNEYSYEINASTGAVIEFESESD